MQIGGRTFRVHSFSAAGTLPICDMYNNIYKLYDPDIHEHPKYASGRYVPDLHFWCGWYAFDMQYTYKCMQIVCLRYT